MAGTGVFADIFDGEVYKYYSDGEWKKSSSGKTVPIINPTTRKTQYKVQGNSFVKTQDFHHLTSLFLMTENWHDLKYK